MNPFQFRTVPTQIVEFGAARRLAVVPVSGPYRVVETASPGSVTGTVTFTGAPLADTVIAIAADQNGCGKPLTITRLARRNGLVSGAVVWLTTVVSMAIVELMFPSIYGGSLIVVGAEVVFLALYLVLAWLAAQERPP